MNTPTSIKLSAAAWIAAITAGVVESTIAVSQQAMEGHLDAGIWFNLVPRIVIYTAAVILTLRLLRGGRYARTGLTILLSVIGLASLVVPATMSLFSGATFLEAFGHAGAFEAAFVVVRGAHILLVVFATVAMFTPSASAYLKRSARTPASPARTR